MNLKLDSNVAKVKFNGSEVDKVKFNGSVVWSKPTAQHIYGVSWSGTGTTTAVLTRTDDAANFADPVPYINDGVMTAADCSSPFDNCYPWSRMTVETIDGNSMVKIPKFWYKITGSAYIQQLQIADYPATGFLLSPAHIDRGYGEQDYIYISKYLVDSNYKSKTNSSVEKSQTMSDSRTSVRALGTGYELFDWALWQTLQMLYLVEFANTDSQTLIGTSTLLFGNTGATDSMPYHTGTMASATNINGRIQYRNIEDLWGNEVYFIDGTWSNYISSSGYKALQTNYLFANYTTWWTGGSTDPHGTANIKALHPISTTVNNSTVINLMPKMAATQTIYNYVATTFQISTSSSTPQRIFCKYTSGIFGGYDRKTTNTGIGIRIQYLPFATSA